MIDHLVALIVDEGKWLALSMGLALLTTSIHLYRYRLSGQTIRHRVLAAMSLFFGVTIGTMAFGHLLAVTTKLVQGTLEGSVIAFFAIGIVLAILAWWLIQHTRRILFSNEHGRMTMVLDAWLAITLLVLGIHNLPLAFPAFFNIVYHLHSRKVIGWTVVSLAVVVNVSLFIGSLIFMASGQSFEQFSGIE